MSDEKMLVVPSPFTDGTPIKINLEEIVLAEVRQLELGHATTETAKELSVEFNKQWLHLNDIYTNLNAEKVKAEKELASREAVIQLDLMKDILAKKGVGSTADTRKAVIILDEEYKKLSNLVDYMTAVVELIKGKMKGFENAFSVAKRIIGDSGYMNKQRNPNLVGSSYAATVVVESKPVRTGFGRSKTV